MGKKKDKVFIFDTTLRDGEQAPGASLSKDQKLEIAMALESLGVDVIEAGFPISSEGNFNAVSAIAQKLKKCSVCGLARCVKKDIDAVGDSLKKAKNPRIHVFLATSRIHIRNKFRKPESEVLKLIRDHIKLAREKFSDIEFSPEDATRTDREFLFKVIEEAIKQGATTINIPDTVGYSYPQEVSSLVEDILNNVPNVNKAVLSIHCHNDLGMATANSLAAVYSGVRQIHCTINGIGERAGNASLEEIVMALKTRKDIFKNIKAGVDTKKIYKTSRLVSSFTGFLLPPNKAIVGNNAFRHEAGIHQDAVLKERSTYEIMDPRDIGVTTDNIVLGRHSGRHALSKRLSDLGFKLNKSQFQEVFQRFKVLADKKKEVFDDDLIALIEDEIKPQRKIAKLVKVKVESGTDVVPISKLSLDVKGKVSTVKSTGDGPVDASFKAIDKILKVKPKLLQYKLEAVTSGRDALGQVRVELRVRGSIISGISSSTDIVEASVNAYLNALNKVL